MLTWKNGEKPNFVPIFTPLHPPIFFVTKQTWEIGERPNFRFHFELHGPDLGLQNFFRGYFLYYLSVVAANYHRMQFQRKRMIHTQENSKKPHFGPDLIPLDTNSPKHFSLILIVLGFCLSYVSIEGIPTEAIPCKVRQKQATKIPT